MVKKVKAYFVEVQVLASIIPIFQLSFPPNLLSDIQYLVLKFYRNIASTWRVKTNNSL